MDNEATKILNPESENQVPKAAQAEQREVKNVSKFMGRATAATVGTAVGVGAVDAAEHIYNRATAETEVGPKQPEEIQQETQMSTESVAHTQTATHGDSHTETTSPHTTTAQATETTPETSDAVPSDASYIDDDAPATPSSDSDSEPDNEVHVVGVAIQDNGNGGMATIARLQSGEETAIVVDVDSDGTIDIIGIDENHNGRFELNELHDASEAQLSTNQIICAYVEEAHEHGVQAVVTNLYDGSQYHESGYGLASLEDESNQNMYEASNGIPQDDMPDYMNDADAGIMDA